MRASARGSIGVMRAISRRAATPKPGPGQVTSSFSSCTSSFWLDSAERLCFFFLHFFFFLQRGRRGRCRRDRCCRRHNWGQLKLDRSRCPTRRLPRRSSSVHREGHRPGQDLAGRWPARRRVPLLTTGLVFAGSWVCVGPPLPARGPSCGSWPRMSEPGIVSSIVVSGVDAADQREGRRRACPESASPGRSI